MRLERGLVLRRTREEEHEYEEADEEPEEDEERLSSPGRVLVELVILGCETELCFQSAVPYDRPYDHEAHRNEAAKREHRVKAQGKSRKQERGPGEGQHLDLRGPSRLREHVSPTREVRFWFGR